MACKTALLVFLSLSSSSLALPIRREVPQEHSHEPFLTSVRASLASNNPDQISDPVFGLLGDAAAAGGAGKIKDVSCLQQATADQAFTNAKAAGDVQGQVDAMIYRALERNTGKVGQASAACTSIKAVNPEIAAIQQHQDPASNNAAAVNKAVTLELAKQIAAVGGNPQDALKAGTFAPGKLTDTSGKGNTCDVQNDPKGCIFSQNLLVPDATAAEIDAAVAGVKAAGAGAAAGNGKAAGKGNAGGNGKAAGNGNAGGNGKGAGAAKGANNAAGAGNAAGSQGAASAAADAAACSAVVTSTVTVTVDAAGATQTAAAAADAAATATEAAAADASAAPAPAATGAPAAAGNLQTFTGALGGAAAPPVTAGGRGFVVDGSDFLNKAAAIGRSCDVQHNACANVANSAAGKAAGLTVNQCDKQNTQCRASA